jgi:hypothetical protein
LSVGANKIIASIGKDGLVKITNENNQVLKEESLFNSSSQNKFNQPKEGSSPINAFSRQKPVLSKEKKGGIDLRSLPIATQQAPFGISAANALRLTPIPLAQLNNEWKQIENMLSAGIVPSTDRIKIYLESCYSSGSSNQETDKVLSCLAQILRMDEERVVLTDPALKEMLVLLESDRATDELRLSLAKIVVQEKEPKALKE